MKVGLYFGSFNPVHVGHMVIANHIAEFSDLNRIWFVVTPLNPFKKKQSLLADHQRLEMVYLATKDYSKLKPSNIEFKLPQPNYTINTLTYIQEKYPDHTFNLIMGEDNLNSLHKWKNYELIIENHDIYVYPRITEVKPKNDLKHHPKVHFIDAPIMEISSTFIRHSIKEGKNARALLPDAVWSYLDEMNFYK